MSDVTDKFNPYEMRIFGLDPAVEADRAEWVNTTPPEGIRIVDYKDDAYAFGSIATGQAIEPNVE